MIFISAHPFVSAVLIYISGSGKLNMSDSVCIISDPKP